VMAPAARELGEERLVAGQVEARLVQRRGQPVVSAAWSSGTTSSWQAHAWRAGVGEDGCDL
jgi:hypothetical protein